MSSTPLGVPVTWLCVPSYRNISKKKRDKAQRYPAQQKLQIVADIGCDRLEDAFRSPALKIFQKQDHHHIYGDQAARRPHIVRELCSLIWGIDESWRLFMELLNPGTTVIFLLH